MQQNLSFCTRTWSVEINNIQTFRINYSSGCHYIPDNSFYPVSLYRITLFLRYDWWIPVLIFRKEFNRYGFWAVCFSETFDFLYRSGVQAEIHDINGLTVSGIFCPFSFSWTGLFCRPLWTFVIWIRACWLSYGLKVEMFFSWWRPFCLHYIWIIFFCLSKRISYRLYNIPKIYCWCQVLFWIMKRYGCVVHKQVIPPRKIVPLFLHFPLFL